MPPQRTRTRNWLRADVGRGHLFDAQVAGGMNDECFHVCPDSERRGDAAVDIEDVAVDEVGRVAGEEHRRADQVFDVAPAARRRAPDQPAAELGVVDQRFGQLGLEVARARAR